MVLAQKCAPRPDYRRRARDDKGVRADAARSRHTLRGRVGKSGLSLLPPRRHEPILRPIPPSPRNRRRAVGLVLEHRVLAGAPPVHQQVEAALAVGLDHIVGPHVVRLIWGSDYRHLVPMSAILGAGFLILADLGARVIAIPTELPVGIITAFFGAPFFIYILKTKKRPQGN